jgi:hypothetical protein
VAPILNNPVLKANPTESPVSKIGPVVNNHRPTSLKTLSRNNQPPSIRKRPLNELKGLNINIMINPIINPAIIAKIDEEIATRLCFLLIHCSNLELAKFLFN